jgi:hypothetical protein
MNFFSYLFTLLLVSSTLAGCITTPERVGEECPPGSEGVADAMAHQSPYLYTQGRRTACVRSDGMFDASRTLVQMTPDGFFRGKLESVTEDTKTGVAILHTPGETGVKGFAEKWIFPGVSLGVQGRMGWSK